MDQQKLIRIYKILGFTDEDIEKTFEDISGIQQVAVSNELLRVLDKDEINALNGLEKGSGPERAAILEGIIGKHKDDPVFTAKAQEAVQRVVDEHVAYLKTRGSDEQKARIAQVLAEV